MEKYENYSNQPFEITLSSHRRMDETDEALWDFCQFRQTIHFLLLFVPQSPVYSFHKPKDDAYDSSHLNKKILLWNRNNEKKKCFAYLLRNEKRKKIKTDAKINFNKKKRKKKPTEKKNERRDSYYQNCLNALMTEIYFTLLFKLK